MGESMRHPLRVTVMITLLLVTQATTNVDSSSATTLSQPQQMECQVEPRTLAEIEGLVAQATPYPRGGTPLFIIDALPEGHAPDRAASEGVISAVLVLNACASTGSSLQYYALTTDGYVQRTAANENSTTFLAEIQATPTVTASDMNRYIAAIGHILELSDHRASAIVTLGGVEDSHPAPGRTLLMIFVNVDGRWLLDGMYSQVWSDESADMPVWIADLFPPNT